MQTDAQMYRLPQNYVLFSKLHLIEFSDLGKSGGGKCVYKRTAISLANMEPKLLLSF